MTPDPLTLNGVDVEDALVNTNAGCANAPELYVRIDGNLKHKVHAQAESGENGEFVKVLCDGTYLYPRDVHISIANELLQRYVNGSLGSDSRSLTWHEREISRKYRWDQLELYVDREDFAELNDRQYAFVPDRIASWAPVSIDSIMGNGGHEMQSASFDKTLEDVYEEPRYDADTNSDKLSTMEQFE